MTPLACQVCGDEGNLTQDHEALRCDECITQGKYKPGTEPPAALAPQPDWAGMLSMVVAAGVFTLVWIQLQFARFIRFIIRRDA